MSPTGNTVEGKRQTAQSMRSETLAQLYEVHPYVKTKIDQAVGYGVFSNVGINLFLLSTASGWGIVRDKKTGQDTYMKMYSAGMILILCSAGRENSNRTANSRYIPSTTNTVL